MEERICPICRKSGYGDVCQECGADLEKFNQTNAKVRELLGQGIEAMDAKAYVGALQLLEQGLQLNPKDSAVLLMAGLCHYALGDWEKAEHCWKNSQNSLAADYRFRASTEEDGFKRVATLYNQALNLLQYKKYPQAIRVLKQALKAGKPWLPVLELLALTYFEGKKYLKCWKVYRQIEAMTVDAPVLAKLAPDLYKNVSRLRYAIGAVCLMAILGGAGFWFRHSLVSDKQVRAETAAKVTEKKPVKVALSPVKREQLQAKAQQLARQGDYLGSAEALVELNEKSAGAYSSSRYDEEILSKAAAHHYFTGMRQLREEQYDEAAVSFSMSLRYPVHSYVYDDTLYYQAVVRERLEVADQAIVLYRQLLKEAPESTYCQSAVVRWSRLAKAQPKFQPDYLKAMKEYPGYAALMQSRAKTWKE